VVSPWKVNFTLDSLAAEFQVAITKAFIWQSAYLDGLQILEKHVKLS
jgi:hypothetical protein